MGRRENNFTMRRSYTKRLNALRHGAFHCDGVSRKAAEREGVEPRSVESGEVFGGMALIDHAPRSGSAVAATDCRLMAVNEQRFLRLVGEVPMFALNLMQVITHRLRRAPHG